MASSDAPSWFNEPRSKSLIFLIFASDCFTAKAATKHLAGERNHFSLAVQNPGNRGWLSSDQQMTAEIAGKCLGDS